MCTDDLAYQPIREHVSGGGQINWNTLTERFVKPDFGGFSSVVLLMCGLLINWQ